MNSVYIVMSSPVGKIYEEIVRIFTRRTDAEKFAEYLKRTDKSFNQWEYYVIEHEIFDYFNEAEEFR